MADTNPPGPDNTPDADLPASLASLTFHGPLSEARASRLVGRLTRTRPATVLDIGCGWGELLLRMLAAAPGATGVGLDTDQGDLARGRDNARARGLEDRVAFVRESGVGTTRGPADLVLCVGASHAVSDADPPAHTGAALRALRRLVTPHGRVLFGEGFWQRIPTEAELAAMWPGTTVGDMPDLAGLVDLAVEAGFRPAWIEVASSQEWDDFESGYQCDEEEWLAAHHDHPRAAELRGRLDQHRSHWLRGYRDILGLAYLTLVPVGPAQDRRVRRVRAEAGCARAGTVPGPEVSMRPATPDELQSMLPRVAADYAAEIVAAGSLPPAQAQAKAERDVIGRFAETDGAPNQFVFRLLADRQPVGWLWLAVPAPGGDPAMAWVSNVEVDEEFRGRGYGRQAMLLAEQEARARGMTSVGLNVHGSNVAARGLYESLGYQVTTQQLKKPV